MLRIVICSVLVMGAALICAAGAGAAESKVYRYVVRGEIRQMPSRERAEVFIKHDPIPDYVGRDGAVVGLRAMTMPFWVRDGVSLEGLKVGDLVEFGLESAWEPKAYDAITSIKVIAPGDPEASSKAAG